MDQAKPSIIMCLQVVAEEFGHTVEQLLRRDNSQPIARRRQMAMWLARKATDKSTPQIGKTFGRDHTTISYGVMSAEGHRYRDNEFREVSDRLLATLVPAKRVDISAAHPHLAVRFTEAQREVIDGLPGPKAAAVRYLVDLGITEHRRRERRIAEIYDPELVDA